MNIPARGLLFDADGVLVDSDASVERAWTRWSHRWDLDPAAVLAMVHGRRSADTVALPVESTRPIISFDGIVVVGRSIR